MLSAYGAASVQYPEIKGDLESANAALQIVRFVPP
jgi:hypothetical protein